MREDGHPLTLQRDEDMVVGAGQAHVTNHGRAVMLVGVFFGGAEVPRDKVDVDGKPGKVLDRIRNGVQAFDHAPLIRQKERRAARADH